RNYKLSLCFVGGIHRVKDWLHSGLCRTFAQSRKALSSIEGLLSTVGSVDVLSIFATPHSISTAPATFLKSATQGGLLSARVFLLVRVHAYDLVLQLGYNSAGQIFCSTQCGSNSRKERLLSPVP